MLDSPIYIYCGSCVNFNIPINFQELANLCCLLAWYSSNDDHFQGLPALGLAIAQCNNNLVSSILAASKVDMDQIYDTFWGNPLTTFLKIHGESTDPSVLETVSLCLRIFSKHLSRINACLVMTFISCLLHEKSASPSRHRS